MPRKIKQKQKQKQRQKQTVIVNIGARRASSSKTTPSPKPFIPMMPSFNINQPVPSPLPDLAKIIGLLSPALQTHSKLGTAVNNAVQPSINTVGTQTDPMTNTIGTQTIGSLRNPLYAPTIGEAVQYAKKKPIIPEKPEKPEKPLDFPTEEEPSVTPSIYGEKPMSVIAERYLKSIKTEARPAPVKIPEPVRMPTPIPAPMPAPIIAAEQENQPVPVKKSKPRTEAQKERKRELSRERYARNKLAQMEKQKIEREGK